MSVRFDANNSIVTPLGVFIIGTYDEKGVPNAMNAAWGIQSDFGEITLFLSKHKTTDDIEKNGDFTIAFGTVDTVTISDYFGVESGKNVDKIAKAGCHARKSEVVNAPIIEEYPVTLECKLRSWDPETGMLVGQIVGQVADESVITDGNIDLDKLRPVIYDSASHSYREIGKVVGKAYSDGLKIKGSRDKWDN